MTNVSIIIPYRNVENYISQCLESIINQTLKDIEIICINDSSDDKSLEIVKEYALKDNRIIMLQTPEISGQAYARNMGLEIAKGEYIGFVDSDDWVELDMFEKMYNRAKLNNTDITLCKSVLYDDKTKEYTHNPYYDLEPLKHYTTGVFTSFDTKNEILDINVVLWNKIYKREFLENTGEKFPNGFIYEDLPFFYGTYLKAERINIIWESLYYYRQNRQYSTMQNIDKKIYDRIPMVSLTYDKLKKASFYKEKEVEILSWIIDDIFHRFTLLDEKYYKEYFYMMKRLFQSFGLEGDEKYKLATCYCFEEYCSILKNNYFDFWKFLIEKYKLANKKVKMAQHEKNLFVQDFTAENERKIEELNASWQKTIEDKEKHWQAFVEEENKRHKEELDNLYWSMNDKLVQQEYALKKWQAQSLREREEKLTADYEWKLKVQQDYCNKALLEQKEYYENNFLLVKIIIKTTRKIMQIKNKIKKILKKN